MKRPPIIGIVGGIGSGKSAVASVFRDQSCVVSDSDALAHAALRDPVVRDQLVSWWGRGVLDLQGEIDRSAVGRIVFADAEQRRRLESLVHPWIGRERDREFASAPPGTPACIIDAPLLLEAGLDSICDAVVFVDAPRATRLHRVHVTRGWSDAELSRREATQWSLDRKRAAADHVIMNDAGPDALVSAVRRVLDAVGLSRARP